MTSMRERQMEDEKKREMEAFARFRDVLTKRGYQVDALGEEDEDYHYAIRHDGPDGWWAGSTFSAALAEADADNEVSVMSTEGARVKFRMKSEEWFLRECRELLDLIADEQDRHDEFTFSLRNPPDSWETRRRFWRGICGPDGRLGTSWKARRGKYPGR